MSLQLIEQQREIPHTELAKAGMIELCYKFEQGFREYIGQRYQFFKALDRSVPSTYPLKPIMNLVTAAFEEGNPTQCATNFSRYEGFLEKGCNAAQALVPEYDI